MSEFRKLVERIFVEHNIVFDEDFPTVLDLNPIPHRFPTFNLDEGDGKVFDKDSGYNSSLDEEYYWDLIKKKWPDAEKSVTLDWFRNPENHRPWQIDFYIPSERMMIQLNGHVKHGRRPYNPADPKCQEDVEWLKTKSGDFYKKILYTWTELEPLKRKIAKENGYRYIELFNPYEFNTWYEHPELNYEEYKQPIATLQYDSDEYFAQKDKGVDIYGNSSALMSEDESFNIGDIVIVKNSGKVLRIADIKELHGRQIILGEYPIADPVSYIDFNNDRVDSYNVKYQKTTVPASYCIKGTEEDMNNAINNLSL